MAEKQALVARATITTAPSDGAVCAMPVSGPAANAAQASTDVATLFARDIIASRHLAHDAEAVGVVAHVDIVAEPRHGAQVA